MLPALARAREAGRRAGCFNNLRQIELATRLYVDNNHDNYPPTWINSQISPERSA
jgi:hypothetical protein